MAAKAFANLPQYCKDFVRISKSFGSLKKDENILKLVRLIYSKRLLTTPSGSFWTSDVIDSINKDSLITRFLESNRSPKILLDILISEIIKEKNINLLGFRAPVHIAYSECLRKWYPSSKILFIIRDPRAVYISTIKKNERYKLNFPNYFLRIIMYIQRISPSISPETFAPLAIDSPIRTSAGSSLSRNLRRFSGESF